MDDAHSPESMDACARWFTKVVNGHQNSTSFSSLTLSPEDGLKEIKFSTNGFNDYEKGSRVLFYSSTCSGCSYGKPELIFHSSLSDTCFRCDWS